MLLLNQNDEQINESLQEQKKQRIQSIKHKLYVLVLLVCIFIFYPFFESSLSSVKGSSFFDAALHHEQGVFHGLVYGFSDDGLLGQIQSLENQIDQQKKLQAAIEKDQKAIDIMKSPTSLDKIRACSEDSYCEGFSDTLKAMLPELRTFAVLSQLSGSKMQVDQKYLLENIEQQLLRNSSAEVVAYMHGITFSQAVPVQEKEGIYKMPFVMSLEFSSNEQFIRFLKSVEKRIPSTTPVLYKIAAINYDIAKYRQNQKIDITLYAYFYR